MFQNYDGDQLHQHHLPAEQDQHREEEPRLVQVQRQCDGDCQRQSRDGEHDYGHQQHLRHDPRQTSGG